MDATKQAEIQMPRHGTPAEQAWLREVMDYVQQLGTRALADGSVADRMAFQWGAVSSFAAPRPGLCTMATHAQLTGNVDRFVAEIVGGVAVPARQVYEGRCPGCSSYLSVRLEPAVAALHRRDPLWYRNAAGRSGR